MFMPLCCAAALRVEGPGTRRRTLALLTADALGSPLVPLCPPLPRFRALHLDRRWAAPPVAAYPDFVHSRREARCVDKQACDAGLLCSAVMFPRDGAVFAFSSRKTAHRLVLGREAEHGVVVGSRLGAAGLAWGCHQQDGNPCLVRR